jgi:MFS family permease
MPRALMLGTLAVLVVIVVANNSMGALAQPEIAEAFLAGPADVGWVVFGFSASFAVSTAIWGAIGRRFGIGRGLAAGIVVLSIFSLAAAAAPSLPLLVAARVIQGFGAGAIPTLGTALIGTRYSGPSRASALGVIVGSVGTGQAVGPLLGGALIDLAGWRAVVGLAVLVAPTAAIMLRSHPAAGDNQARIDITGALLVGIAAFAAVLALNRLPVDGLAPLTIIAVASLVLALPAVGWHSLVRGGSFLPKQVLLEPTYRRLVLLGAVGMSAFLGSIVIVPIAISRVQGLMGLELGLVLVPMALTTALLSPNNGRVTRRLGHANTVHLSLGLLAAGPLSLAVLGAGASPIALAAALVPLGAGFSLLNAPLLEQLMLVFEGPLAPIAVGSYNLLFFLGGSLGAALSTALVEARVRLPLMPAGSAEPGFVTSAVLLCVLPAAAALLLGRARMRMSQ